MNFNTKSEEDDGTEPPQKKIKIDPEIWKHVVIKIEPGTIPGTEYDYGFKSDSDSDSEAEPAPEHKLELPKPPEPLPEKNIPIGMWEDVIIKIEPGTVPGIEFDYGFNSDSDHEPEPLPEPEQEPLPEPLPGKNIPIGMWEDVVIKIEPGTVPGIEYDYGFNSDSEQDEY